MNTLSYEQYIKNFSLEDSPLTKIEYNNYIIDIKEKNKKADMRLSKFIGTIAFFVIFLAIFSMMCYQKISATSPYDFVLADNSITPDYSNMPTQPFIFTEIRQISSGNSFVIYAINLYSSSYDSVMFYSPKQLQDFYTFVTRDYGEMTYQELIDTVDSLLNTSFPDFEITSLDYSATVLVALSTLTNEQFNNLYPSESPSLPTYEQGYTNGIKDSFDVVEEYLTNNNMLYEPITNNGTLSNVDMLVTDNFDIAISNATQSGIAQGYENGYDVGYGVGFENGSNSSYEGAYNKGYTDGVNEGEVLKKGIFAIFDGPLKILGNLLNFEIFGVNLLSLFQVIITVSLLAIVAKYLLSLFLR